jgi:hypothetical protein
VDAEHLSIDYSSQGEEIKNLTASFPYRGVAVLGLALLVETIDLRYLSRLVVSADKCDSVRESGVVSVEVFPCVRGASYLAFKHINSVNVSRLK